MQHKTISVIFVLGAFAGVAGLAGAAPSVQLQRVDPDVVRKLEPAKPRTMEAKPRCIAGFSVRNAQHVQVGNHGGWTWDCVSQKPIRCGGKLAPYDPYMPWTHAGSGFGQSSSYNGGAFKYSCDTAPESPVE